jgi:hypothetical protein
METTKRTSPILAGTLWMLGISLVLSFIPIINGFIGGLVGGYKVGTARRAVVAALLPAVILAVASSVILAAFDLPVIGIFSGLTLGAVAVFSSLGMVAGAALGGGVANRRDVDGARLDSRPRRPLPPDRDDRPSPPL